MAQKANIVAGHIYVMQNNIVKIKIRIIPLSFPDFILPINFVIQEKWKCINNMAR